MKRAPFFIGVGRWWDCWGAVCFRGNRLVPELGKAFYLRLLIRPKGSGELEVSGGSAQRPFSTGRT